MATAPTYPKLPAVRTTFVSQRSANTAINKAGRAYEHALLNRCTDAMHSPGFDKHSTKVNTYITEAWAQLETTYKAAEAAGFYAHSQWVK